MEAFLFTYHYIMLEFLFGLYLFYGMTLWNLHRADRFWLRLILGFACVLTLTGLSVLGTKCSGPQHHLHRSLRSHHRARPAML